MFVGDHPVRDADSARSAGLVAVLVRYGGKYAGVAGLKEPDYVLGGVGELLAIIDRDFQVPAASG
jgi:phosphoglycolate phosphatase-like HAD superfamily hydrolase